MRRKMIQASDAAKVLGLSKFGTIMDVWIDKTDPNPPIDAPHLMGGRKFEQVILEWFADVEQCEIEFADPFEIISADRWPRVGATLDALRLPERTPIDAKLIDRPKASEWGEPGSDDMPVYYAVQLVVQMAVVDAPFAELAVRFPGAQPVGFRIHRDLDVEREVMGRCQDFYERHVLTRVPPPIDNTESYASYLKSRLTQATQQLVLAEPEMHTIVVNREEARERLEHAEAEVRFFDNVLKATIGSNRGLQGPTWRATWAKDRDSIAPDYKQIALILAREAEHLKWDRDHFEDPTAEEREARDAFVESSAIVRLREMERQHTYVSRIGPRKLVVKYDEQYPVSPSMQIVNDE